MLENYSRIRLLTDDHQSEGAQKGSIGYIIETYPDGAYEVEFSDSHGVNYARFVARQEELQLAESALANAA